MQTCKHASMQTEQWKTTIDLPGIPSDYFTCLSRQSSWLWHLGFFHCQLGILQDFCILLCTSNFNSLSTMTLHINLMQGECVALIDVWLYYNHHFYLWHKYIPGLDCTTSCLAHRPVHSLCNHRNPPSFGRIVSVWVGVQSRPTTIHTLQLWWPLNEDEDKFTSKTITLSAWCNKKIWGA